MRSVRHAREPRDKAPTTHGHLHTSLGLNRWHGTGPSAPQHCTHQPRPVGETLPAQCCHTAGGALPTNEARAG